MDFDKIKEYGNNIKMPEEIKKEILVECKANQNKEKSSKNNMLWLPKIKRTVAVACGLIFVFGIGLLYNRFFSGNNLPVDNTESIVSENRQTSMPSDSVTSTASETIASTAKEDLTSDVGGGSISTRKYRVNYYDVPYQFVLIVGEDTYWEWDEQYNNENPDETNVMVMKKFIEFFDISREDFDRANLEWTKVIFNKMGGKPVMNPKDFANQETDEAYNADIIYTFDDEIINEYYLSGYYPYIFESEYEEAVANGEYTSQTKDWIDIEQMEAEINAKYGEPEATE